MKSVPHFALTAFHKSSWAPRTGELDRPNAYGTLTSHDTYAARIALPQGVQSCAADEEGRRKRYGREVVCQVVALIT